MLSHPGPVTVTVTVAADGQGVSSDDAYSGSSVATAGDGRHLQSPDLEPASESVIEHTVPSHPVTVTVTVAAADRGVGAKFKLRIKLAMPTVSVSTSPGKFSLASAASESAG